MTSWQIIAAFGFGYVFGFGFACWLVQTDRVVGKK